MPWFSAVAKAADGEYARSPAYETGAGKRVGSAATGANASQTGRQATQLEP